MTNRRRKVLVIIALFLTALISLEIFLRKVWGLGSMVLFKEDKAIEYLPAPNQHSVRFGNKIVYNEYSMRGLPIEADDGCIVLGFGDSVLNGGTLTDQDSLATTIVEKQLQQINAGIRFLNISAGSWGPDNCAAYLNKYGSFNAKMIILFVSSHDAYDNMTFEKIVGIHKSYPKEQYSLALLELLERYVQPRLMNLINENNAEEDLMINKNGVGFNSGFDFFTDYTKKNQIPFLVCLHAESAEVKAGKFNTQGEEILRFCEKNGIKVISGFEIGEDLKDFRDTIHLNERGQKRWAKTLAKEIQATIKACL
jgi:lysophospholipase L1-like esterase